MRTTDNQILLTIVQHKLKDKKGVWIQLTEYATLVPGVGYLILSIPIGLADLWVIATYTCCYRLLLLYILTAALLMILAQVLVGVVSYLQKNTMCKWSAVFCRSRCSVGCYPVYFFYVILILCLRIDATCLGYILLSCLFFHPSLFY